MLSRLAGSQQVLDSQKFPFPNHRQDALMCICSRQSGELISRFKSHTDTGRPAEVDQPFQALISTLTGHADMIELTRTRTKGLFDRVEAV